MFLISSQTCALQQDGALFKFINPDNANGVAVGNWDDVVLLAMKILTQEYRQGTTGPITTIFTGAEKYADGILNNSITEENEDFANNIITTIEYLKAYEV